MYENMTRDQMSPIEQLLHDRYVFEYREIVSRIRNMAPPLESSKIVLDIGCGVGFGTSILSSTGREVMGLDIDAEAVKFCRKEYPHLRFEWYDGHTLDKVPSNSVSAIALVHVLEHIEQDSEFLAELRRVLVSDGMLFVATPNRDVRLAEGERPWNPGHVREYSSPDLRKIFSEVGFDRYYVLGVDSSAEARAAELKRIKKVKRVARLDPLYLRRYLPASIVHGVAVVLERKILSRTKPPQLRRGFRFSAGPEMVRNSLDLFAVARR